MALHHHHEMQDMRSAYDQDDVESTRRSSATDSERSGRSLDSGSGRSYSTELTEQSTSSRKRSPQIHHDTGKSRPIDVPTRRFNDRPQQESARSSALSIIPSDDEQEQIPPSFDIPEYTVEPYESSVIASTPADFSELFPSSHRLDIRHDDTTLDGNMNLRVDTEVSIHGRRRDMTLFHLRMHDLRDRGFSLRRYCRDSGREVCHSSLKRQQQGFTSEKRSGLKSLNNALNSVRSRSEQKFSTSTSLKRHDSGYGSLHSMESEGDDRPRSSGQASEAPPRTATNVIKLEFSNYAQVDVRRTGVKRGKRYEFDYWGVSYAWRRTVRESGDRRQVAYYLTRAGSKNALGYIIPNPLTPEQEEDERRMGGWIPPCSMWIADKTIVESQKDVSDVVVACGLMALVDDSIRSFFQSKSSKTSVGSSSEAQSDAEPIGSKRLINGVFHRRGTDSSRQSRPSSGS